MKKITLLLSIFLLVLVKGFGQNIEFDKKNFPNDKEGLKIAEKELKEADELFNWGEEQYLNALKHYLNAHTFNPNNAHVNYRIGWCILNTRNKAESAAYFEKAYKLDPKISPQIYYCLGHAHHYNEDWDEALMWYKKHEDHLRSLGRAGGNLQDSIHLYDHLIEECKYGKELSSKPIRVFIDNIGPEINSEYYEYGVIVSADESSMLFTSRRPGSIGSKKESNKEDAAAQNYMEDIYLSKRDSKGKWTLPVNLGEPVNSDEHDATVYLSPDGQKSIIYRSDKSGGGLYETTLDGDKWSRPKKFDKNINSKYHESSASFSLDGKTLYFVSDNPENNMGGHDIFVSHWNEEKQEWGDPLNFGAHVNTEWEERAVFMHPDGRTLYFSSEGHTSMGGFDIFKTVYEDGKWGNPINVGYPVNTPDDDIYFVMSANNKRGYYSSYHKDGYGKTDVYVITFLGPEKDVISSGEDNLLASVLKPVTEDLIEPEVKVMTSNTTILKGIVLDDFTSKPVAAKLDLIDNTSGELVATFNNNSITGNFLVSLPSGRNYGIAVYAEHYLFHSENFDIPKSKGYNEVYKEVRLKNLEVGKSIVLKNIFFDVNKATLRSESKSELERLIKLMNDVPTLKIEISGHTDSDGSDTYNQKLSENRAKSVVDYLIEHGVASGRMEFVGHGEIQPIDTNDTEEGKQNNRRTEFKILSK